jgi:hypothetical protein
MNGSMLRPKIELFYDDQIEYCGKGLKKKGFVSLGLPFERVCYAIEP